MKHDNASATTPAPNTEIEARWINLDHAAMERRLAEIGARKEGSFFFEEWILAHPEWRADNKRVRVRTDGRRSWVTYKANPSWGIDTTEEIELEISSARDMVSLLEKAGIPLVRHQEKKRDSYALGDIVFDLDLWPKIPMVLEIEAPSEGQVREGARLLGLDWKDAIFEDQAWVHKIHYGIDIFSMSEYCFPA